MVAAEIAEGLESELVELFECEGILVEEFLGVGCLVGVGVPEREGEAGSPVTYIYPPDLHIISLEVLLKMET